MSILSSLFSSSSPLALILIIALPSLPSLLTRVRQPSAPSAPSPPSPRRFKALLALNAAYHLYALFSPPYNVFHAHGLPITIDVPILRRYLARAPAHAHVLKAPAEGDRLIGKLSNLDYRLLYARYGHEALASCAWCASYDDYALVALPRVVLPYLSCAVLLGIMGWEWVGGPQAGARAQRWRSPFGWCLGMLALVEVGARYLWDIRVIEGDCIQLDALLHTPRSLIPLLLPIIYILLPLPSSPSSTYTTLTPLLARTSNLLRIGALARSAVAADRTLRDQWVADARASEARRDAARRDEHVRGAAQRVGLGEGQSGREGAGEWVREQWRGLVRVQKGEDEFAEVAQ